MAKDSGQAGDSTNGEVMAAGKAVFLAWFRQDQVNDCFNSLPEPHAIEALSSSIFDAMIRASPETFRKSFSRSLIS